MDFLVLEMVNSWANWGELVYFSIFLAVTDKVDIEHFFEYKSLTKADMIARWLQVFLF